MSELRFLGTDGEYLLLEESNGTQHKLLIDEGVRKAARRESVSEGDAAKISPRDIQLEVRSGVTIEELANQTGASLEYIEKFAAPVIDELAHVVSSALSVRITMAGDRYSETTQVEFGHVIANRLAATGVAQYTWAARKTDNGGWQLRCSFEDSVALWAFDPRKLALAPENEVAVQLSTQQSLTDGPLPKLRPVMDTVAPAQGQTPFGSPASSAAPSAPQQSATSQPPQPVTGLGSQGATIPNAPAAPVRLAPVPTDDFNNPLPAKTVSVTEELGKTGEFEGVVPFGRSSKAPESEPAPDLANTADLLDALRKRRMSREEQLNDTGAVDTDNSEEPSLFDAVAPQPVTSSILVVSEPVVEPSMDAAANQDDIAIASITTMPINVVAAQQDSDAETFVDEPAEVEPTEDEAKPAPKRGRSSMPSWDEIVFSTRADDEDD